MLYAISLPKTVSLYFYDDKNVLVYLYKSLLRVGQTRIFDNNF
jgi:hypothetical protein